MVFPLADTFGNRPDSAAKDILAQTQHPTGLQNLISGAGSWGRVAANKIDQAWPIRNNGRDLIPLPSLVLLANGAKLPSGLILSEVQEQALGAEMLTKRFGIQIESFASQISEAQGTSGGFEGEVAKRQNRVTCILNEPKQQMLGRVPMGRCRLVMSPI